MKRFICSLLLSFAALALAMPSTARAEDKKRTPVPINHTVIGSISSDSITVNSGVNSTNTKTYKIDKFTRLFFAGKQVTPGDLKPGMRVNVTMGSTDKTVAAVITASAPPKPTPPPKK